MENQMTIVTLDNPYACHADPIARHFFGELIDLRAAGYGPDYQPYFLPLDSTDYVSFHHFFCIKKEGELFPVGGLRQIMLETSDQYQLDLHGYKFLKEHNAETHIRAYDEILNFHRRTREPLLYSSTFTIRKEYRTDRTLCELIRELVPAMVYEDVTARKATTTLGGAAVRFKTDIAFSKWGFKPLEFNGTILPPVIRKEEKEDAILMMYFKKMSDFSRMLHNKHRDLIDSRLIITPRPTESEKVAA